MVKHPVSAGRLGSALRRPSCEHPQNLLVENGTTITLWRQYRVKTNIPTFKEGP